MKIFDEIIQIEGLVGQCGQRQVFMGFAPASTLFKLSFADVLNDDTGEGYQRPYNKQHSLSFKDYILKDGSSTIPLTFNLRSDLSGTWKITTSGDSSATLLLNNNAKSLTQVDCQHRLGELKDVDVPLAFMSYIGLSLRDEMALFTIINSKAKGLSSSLTDFHESNLIGNLASEAPHLFLARKMNEDPDSPWFKLIRYGGETTSGLKRRTSFRMMQRAIRQFLKSTKQNISQDIQINYEIINNYWKAVRNVFPDQWSDHRHNLITKGVGLYALSKLLSDVVINNHSANFSVQYFEDLLLLLRSKIDWSSAGTFASAGGQKGASEAHLVLRKAISL
jgi:DNA sulfur modification protein DndB